MENPLHSLLEHKYSSVQIYGPPGTYKTTFLVNVIRKKLEEGCNNIYLIDNSGHFPIARLKPIRHLLSKMIVFHPKTLMEEANLLDDLDLHLLSENSILLIDDVFRHVNLENRDLLHLNSYILALIKSISKTLEFPILITNQGRSYEKKIRPFLQYLTIQYLDWHFLFEKSRNPRKILITFFDHSQYMSQREYSIDSSGSFLDL
ncbi:MAG: hypothetical protein ACXAC8_01480 [Candidatus Hodarchaeales archaeon]|jgi:hypothetical protein